jgi:endonuclease/exonuclease/phosphatase family metal-dependent hydrolase
VVTRRLRVLTYNVQMRSWGMEVGAQGSLTPVTSVEKRANGIADRILAATEPWDVLCFNEVFDEDGRDILEHRLRTAYPHYVLKADADDRGVGALAVVAGGLFTFGGALWGIALGLIGGVSLLGSRWEDSGLMLFSKFPFRGIPIPDALADLVGMPTGTTIPHVAFVPYEDAVGNDENSAKGVVYAQIELPDESLFNIMISHTQADPLDHIGKNATTRKAQFTTAMALLDDRLEGDTADKEILFCGDLNVQGMADANGLRPEWTTLLGTPSSAPLTNVLQDAWTFEQCPGRLLLGSTPLPDDCDPGITAHGQRLDYVLRSNPYPERMVAQHIRIAHNIAQRSPTSPTKYTSDHLPLSIDLHEQKPFNTANTAEKLTFTIDDPENISTATLRDGQMHWYRIDDPGGYGFAMQGGANKVSHAVYTKADLSQPYQPYTRDTTPATDDGPRITRYALAETPFFIRVWLRPNVTSASYSLYSRRFVGTGPKDAIPLLRSWPCRGEARVGALHSPDNPDTPVDDFDSVWFTARLDRTYPGVDDYTSTVTVKDIDGEMFGLVVLRDDGGLGFEVIEERTHGPDPIVVTFNHNQHGRLYVLVRREEPDPRPFDARSFTVLLETNACYLYSNGTERGARALGGDARLICFDETDGFAGSESGSDDIQINVGVNGMNAAHIPHSDDLAFDDDTRRDIVMPTIAYTSQAKFELVELDDFSAADRASVQIPMLPAAVAAAKQIITRDGPAIRGVYLIRFESDDGHYELEITVSREPPID